MNENLPQVTIPIIEVVLKILKSERPVAPSSKGAENHISIIKILERGKLRERRGGKEDTLRHGRGM